MLLLHYILKFYIILVKYSLFSDTKLLSLKEEEKNNMDHRMPPEAKIHG